MKNRYQIMIIIILLGLISSACSLSFLSGDNQNEIAEALQEDVDQLSVLFDAQKLPEHFITENPVRTGNEFDVMSIFTTLDHLTMAEGYVLDYVYNYQSIGGVPLLYVRENNLAMYADISSYRQDHPECSGENQPDSCYYLNYVQTDGSEEGWIQFIVLKMMGRQFYQYWHAGYNDTQILTTQDAVDTLVEDLRKGKFGLPLTLEQTVMAKAIDPMPEVKISSDTVTVRVVWFTHWGGFFETSYSISKDYPHSITELEKKNLVEYDCGIMY